MASKRLYEELDMTVAEQLDARERFKLTWTFLWELLGTIILMGGIIFGGMLLL